MSYVLEFEERIQYDHAGIEVPVVLRSGEQTVDLAAKVDTGSQFCVFARRFGELLGLDVEQGQPLRMSTATGEFQTYGHELTMEVCGYAFDSTVYFAEDGGFARSVLGRVGWLNRCRVAIIDHDLLFYMSPYDSNS